MAMERTDYAALVPQLPPAQAVDVLNDRVREVGRLNTAIADWLQERRKLEEQYASGLRRLARKQFDDVDLGIFSVPWSAMSSSAETIADSHSALAAKIEVDVERPLRDFVGSSREIQGMSTIQGNLLSLSKDVDKAQAKLDRLNDRGADSGRLADAEREFSTAQAQWQSQAPYVFENLQLLDEARLNRLRDVLTQLQTHEVDQVEKSRGSAEHCLNILLQVETADEIQTFILKTLSSKPKTESSVRPSAASVRPSSSNHLTPTRSQPDQESQRSGSVQEEKRKSRFGGLKRLGTVVGKRDSRKRESKMPPGLAPMAEAPERSSKSPFNSFSGRFGKSRDTPTLEPPAEDANDAASQRPSSPLRIGSEILESPQQSQGGVSSPPHLQREDSGALSEQRINGHGNDLAGLDPPRPGQPAANDIESPRIVDSDGYTVPPQALDPITQAQFEAAETVPDVAPAFNVNIRDAPIADQDGQEANEALTSMVGKLAPPVPRSNTVRGRRGVRNSVATSAYIAPDQALSLPEPSATPIAAPVSLSPEPAPTPAVVQPSTVGDLTSSVKAETFVLPPVVSSPLLSSSENQVPTAATSSFTPFTSPGNNAAQRPVSRAVVSSESAGDTGSIRSGASATSQLLKHGELNEVGLNSSIIETVNARFENGAVTSSSLIGEIALAYVPADFSSPFGTETIRLTNFSALEKVAPNPAFITQSSRGEGEYTVKLAAISRPQVAFKYQARLDDMPAITPLLITLAFRVEAKQTSVIVSYSLHPDFKGANSENVILSNVMLGLTLEGTHATACQSKPVGTFSREKNFIFWQLGNLNLRPGASPEKLLARFATESESSGGSVEARWEVTDILTNTSGSGLAITVQSQANATDGADPFADEHGGATAWKPTHGSKKLVSGNYTAK